MSFNVLVIPEDPTWNGYILKPVVERVLSAAGRPRANVTVLSNPRLQGITHALTVIKSADFSDRYKHMDLWLFLPDGDCMSLEAAGSLEILMADRPFPFFCCPAQPEVEIWLLAGHRDKLDLDWQAARTHPRLKESVFEPFLRIYGDTGAVGGGRKDLTAQTLANYNSLKSCCPELDRLEQRIREWIRHNE